MQNRFRRSKRELHGPRVGLKFGPRSSRGVHSAEPLAQILCSWRAGVQLKAGRRRLRTLFDLTEMHRVPVTVRQTAKQCPPTSA
eukprot:7424066-Alexandrium_andersonii.AAC.1